MANPMTVRVAANLAQLQAGMAQAQSVVAGAQASIVRMGTEGSAAMASLGNATSQVSAPAEGLSAKMVGVGAAIGTMAASAGVALAGLVTNGIASVVSGVGELVMKSGEIAGIDRSFRTLADGVNESGAAMLGAMRTGTRGLVTDLDLMTAANKAMLLGLPVTSKEMGLLSTTAVTLGRAMGQTATKSIDDLITALGRSSPMILDNLGLSVKVGEANDVYAAKLGKTSEQLTDAEKKTAFYNAAMAAASAKVTALGQSHLTLGDNIAKAGVWWENFKNDLSIAIARSPALNAAMDVLGKAFASTFGGDTSTRVQTIIGLINRVAMVVVDAGLVLIEWGKTGAQVFGAFQIPIKSVTVVMATLVERFAAGIATMAELASRLPGVGGAFDGVAAATRNAATFWAAAREEAGHSLTASLELARGQGVVHAGLDKVAGVLLTMKAKMVEATLSTKDFTERTDAQRVASRAAADAIAAQGAAAEKAAASQAKFNADLKKFEDHAKVLPPFTGLLDNVDRKVTALAASTTILNSGLRFTAETIETDTTPALEKMVVATEKAIDAAARLGAASSPMPGAGGNLGNVNPTTGEGMSNTDPVVQNYLRAGYTLGEAIALARGGANIGAPHGRWTAQGWKEGLTGFASGGHMNAGQAGIVGERGPELFVPDRSGTVVPNGGGTTIHIEPHFHGPIVGANKQELGRLFGDAVMSVLRANGGHLPPMGV